MTKEKLPVMEDGCVAVPNAPGLGITPDWEFINRHRHAPQSPGPTSTMTSAMNVPIIRPIPKTS